MENPVEHFSNVNFTIGFLCVSVQSVTLVVPVSGQRYKIGFHFTQYSSSSTLLKHDFYDIIFLAFPMFLQLIWKRTVRSM